MSNSAASFFDLSLALQIALGAGYLAYVSSYAGLRRDHGAADQISITLVFSAIALVIVNSTTVFPDAWRVAITLLSTVFLGVFWRKAGRPSWHWLLRALEIHREDGVHSGWAALVQTNRGVSQATIYTEDGRILHLADRAPYRHTEWGGLYLCGDGSVALVVDEETESDGNTVIREDITNADWGTRITYVPSNQIRRVELRMK